MKIGRYGNISAFPSWSSFSFTEVYTAPPYFQSLLLPWKE